MSQQPYIGLRPFERDETGIFFGRDQHTYELINTLSANQFLAVIGVSGCGKSSLVKCGLIAGLEAGYLAKAGTHWRIIEIRPGQQPFENLAEKLLGELHDVLSPHYTAESLQHHLRQGSLSLHEVLIHHPVPNDAQVLIVCDQFEEIFRYFREGASAEIRNFVSLLLASSKPYPLSSLHTSHSLYVVITMRSDYLGDCAQFAGLAEAINQGSYLTPRLDARQLREAIEEPAFVFDGEVEPDLISQLMEDAQNNPDQLPLLQHVLMRLWDLATDKSSSLNLQNYHDKEKVDGLRKALSIHADEAYNELNDEQKVIAQALFSLLTEQDLGKRDTRRPVELCKVMELTKRSYDQVVTVIDVFRRPGRCFLMPPIEVKLSPDSIIDISHESLIRQWQRLKIWIKQEAEAATVYKRLADGATRWRQGQAALLQSPDLEIALAWREKFKPTALWAARYEAAGGIGAQAFELVTDYINQSQIAKQRQIEQEGQDQRRKLKQARLIAILSIAALLIVSALAVWVRLEKDHAAAIEKQRTQELFEARLTHASLLAKGEDYVGAKNILEQTYSLDQDIAASSQHARNLLAGFTEMKGGQAEQVYEGAGYPLYTVAVSPNGELLAAAGEHGTLVIFDVPTGRLLQRLEGHSIEEPILSIAFTPSGEQLISAGFDKKIIVWQPKEKGFSLQKSWPAPDQVSAIAMSPDGNTLASGGFDNNITLWDLASGKAKAFLKKHTRTIAASGLSFSANGAYLASASYDGTAIIWQVQTGEVLQVLTGHTDKVLNAAFSPDGETLATAGQDKTLRLWDSVTGRPLQVLTGHQNKLFAVRFVANGAYLLSAGFDRTIRLWDTRSGVMLRLWQGHDAEIPSIATYANQIYSAGNDGTLRRWALALPYQQAIALPSEPASNAITPSLDNIAVGFADGSLRVYDPDTEHVLSQQLNAHKKRIQRLAFNAQGDLLASGSVDNSAKIWRLSNGSDSDKGISLELQQTLTGHTDLVYGIAFSPNSQTLATASYDGRIGLFPLNSTEKPVFIDKAHQGRVASVSFNQDGTRLLSSGYEDRTTKLWDLQSNPPSLIKDFPKANDSLLWSSFSPDNSLISSVGRGFSITLYDNQNNQLKVRLVGQEDAVLKSTFTPDSSQLVSVSGDATVKFWNLEQGDELFSLRLPADPSPPAPMWDFDLRCEKTCGVAVPLTAGKLLLYQFAYEGRLEFKTDESEQKRVALALWRDYLDLGDTLMRQNAVQPALQASREADAIGNPLMLAHPDDFSIQETALRSFHQHAQLQKSLNHASEALAAYDKAIETVEKLTKQRVSAELYRTVNPGLVEYAEYLTTNQQPVKAAEIYRRLFAFPLEDVDLLVARAEFAHRLGNQAASENDLQQALAKVDKQNAEQLNSVGYNLVYLTNRYQEAYQLLKQAIALKPEDAYILDSIGWAAYKIGNNQEALDYLQKSLAKKDKLLPGGIAETTAHLGEVLAKTGKQNEARKLLKNALRDYPDNQLILGAVKQFAPDLLQKRNMRKAN